MVEWKNAPEEIEESMIGFVYIIVNKTSGKWYIGQKKFWSTKRLPPLKGKVRKRKVTKESDWRKYTGSSKNLNFDIKSGDEIEKTILYIGESKWELNYVETSFQFSQHALILDSSYNGILNLRISSPPHKLDFKTFHVKVLEAHDMLDDILKEFK